MIKLMTLNLWGYHDWEERLKNIQKLLHNENPDIIALQEVVCDEKVNPNPQSSRLANICDYPHQVFVPSMKKSFSINRKLDHGLAIISKFPLLESEAVFLDKHSDDSEQAIVLICKLVVDGRMLSLCNVHYENTDAGAERHLKQTMSLLERKKLSPIILGDFNILNLGGYSSILSSYDLSNSIDAYVSHPKSKATLDYIIVPKQIYSFKEVYCAREYVSDHRAVIADITFKTHKA